MGASKEMLCETSGKNNAGHGKWDKMPILDEGGMGLNRLC